MNEPAIDQDLEELEELEELDPEEEKLRKQEAFEAWQERIQLFGAGLQRLFDEQVALKEELEARWLDDMRHYNGRYDRDTESKMASDDKKSKSSRVFVNITRAKTNTAESKWSDLVLPTDDRNWGLKPTPVPELVDQLEDDEQLTMDGKLVVDENDEPLTKADQARAIMEEAEKKAEAMESEIDDQLVEASYNPALREIIHDACSLGTGVIKGPMVEKRAKRAWIEDEQGDWVLDYREDHKPTAARVDPWNFFPDMSATKWSEVEFVFERHLLTKKEMRKLAKQPGFEAEIIADLLKATPNANTAKLNYLNELREINGITQIHNNNRYEVLEYHGPVDKKALIDCGCQGIDLDDDLEEYEGVVWLCMNKVIKVGLNHMDSQDLPYNVLNWEKDETSIFGFGVPYRMRAPQKVMNASWRMVLDNAGLSTGPQILINRKLVEPADGEWELSPRKLWWMTSNDPNIRADYVMQTFEIDSHQAELTAIFEMAHRLADEETSVPQMQMGNIPGDTQQPAMLKTLGGTALWMSSNNIMMRRAVKNFDDDITDPFITRFYDWNMQFSNKSEIKGDYSIDARGTSVLLVREIQARNLAEFVNLAAAMPGGMEEVKVRGTLKSAAKSLQLNAGDVLRSDAEAKQAEQQEQPPSPEMMELEMKWRIAQEESARTVATLESSERIAMIKRDTEIMQTAAQQEIKLTEVFEKFGLERYKTDIGIRQFYEELAQKEKHGMEANYGLEAEPS